MKPRFSWIAVISAGFLILAGLSAALAPWISPFAFDAQDTSRVLASPSLDHWMGTDRLGRDLFSRLLHGGRLTLFVGVSTTLLALVIGTVFGGVSGYVGGRTDNAMMRIVDVVFALPDLLLIILIMVLFGKGVLSIFIALVMVSWVTVARLVRGEVLKLREYPYVAAARALGAGPVRILWREILPNLWGILLVTLSFRIPVAIMAESTLSFIGLGIAPPASSWGTLANDGWQALKFFPHLILFPAAAIFLTILAFNFLGDALRDRFDPRDKNRISLRIK
ncbi:MAG: ABC transporter permease [Nitrospinaceae bacterium]